MRLQRIHRALFTGAFCAVLCVQPACHRSNSLRARLVRAEQSSLAAERHLDDAEAALRDADPARAERALTEAKTALAEPDVAYYPERESIRERQKALEGRLPAAWAEQKRRELDARVSEQQLALEQPVVKWRESLRALETKSLDPEAVARARDATDGVRDRLKAGQGLENQHPAYAKQAGELRQSVIKEAERVEVAEKTLEFIKGPCKVRHEGLELWKLARAQKDRRKQHAQLDEVRGKFWSCSATAREMMATTPLLAKASFKLDGSIVTPPSVAKGCATRVETLDKSLAALTREEQRRAAKQSKVRRK